MSARPSKPSKQPQVIVLPPDALRALEHPDEPEAGQSYFSFRGVQYVSTISPDVVRAGPSWIPSLPLPFAPDRAVTAARAVLRRIVKDDSAWPVTEITLQPLRNVEPERWFFVVQFTRGRRSDLRGLHWSRRHGEESEDDMKPNQPGCTEPRRASQFQVGRHWRGVGEPGRSL
ncbi:MAG TPA: hypothetical protein VNU68_11885 [Verrucomicrobiae bacterium]|nr:hypothetical protein [Verrucomicrobiae bacterium]